MLEQAVRLKIEDLIRWAGVLSPPGARLRDKEHTAACRSWFTEALNIIEFAIPIDDHPYKRAIVESGRSSGLVLDRVVTMGEILKALLVILMQS